jgi:predicted acetyltransferase
VSVQVRTLDEGDVAGWVECMRTAFLAKAVPGEVEYRRQAMDLDRSWGAFDGGRVVGTLRSFPTELTVPGPVRIAASALTNVTVLPTHRRRGILTQMVARDLRASADRGETVGILIASEYGIYGRFGYGAAVETATYEIDSSQTRFRQDGAGTVELVDLATIRREAPRLYETFQAAQPGAIGRGDQWWDRTVHLAGVPETDEHRGYYAIYRAIGGDLQGYLRYRATDRWDQMRPDGVLHIDELVATSPEGYRGLWNYCCQVDLVRTIEAPNRSVDEPLVWMLADARAVRQTARFDLLWVRMLHVSDALSARRYLVDGHLVIEVLDELGLAGGRYRLDGGPLGASCATTSSSADLSLNVDALGSAYLGGVSLRTLAQAGRVVEHRPESLARADAMFRTAVTPWCTTWF